MPSTGFELVNKGKAATIYIDPEGADYRGLKLVAESLAGDVEMVTGIRPEVAKDVRQLKGTVIIAGTIGQNNLISRLMEDGKINTSTIKGKWETYLLQIVPRPLAGIDKALVIAGSDKRGTIYGIFHISEMIGVSPWIYWADVEPVKKTELILPENSLHFTSKEPSVKYRGIFLNDEWPSLGSWVTNTFGDFNEAFYDKVFNLILRLKGNFLWPAMWSAVFSEDGEKSPTANAELADAYGIVMGTSHHEPMFRAGEEWQRIYRRYGTSNLWDFRQNGEAITQFWEDGVLRNKSFESLITLGMRGERDSTLGGGLQENIDLLKNVISTQKEILAKHGLADAPQILTLYKEVEQFWYGNDTIAGLREWNVLDDVTIMLGEDNFGNVRTLPAPEERNRQAGWGMYYHVDYHGGPVSYEWINTTPIEKIWEQMSMAYDYGVREVWILNVGDLKPMELPTSYFLDLAYDFEAWGTQAINKTREYTEKWVRQQFPCVSDEDVICQIATLLSDYTRLNGIRKPETLTGSTFSLTHYNEAQRILTHVLDIESRAKKIMEALPQECHDTYYQLVYYPAVASANVYKMQIFSGLNKYYYDLGNALANRYAKYVEDTIATDKEMQAWFNNNLSAGKWKGIMSSAHVGYVNWNADGWHYPEVYYLPESEASMKEDMERGKPCSQEFLRATTSMTENFESGMSDPATDNSEPPSSGEAYDPSIHHGGETAIEGIAGFPEMTFIAANRLVSMEAEHVLNNVSRSNASWKVIENYGRTLSSVKMFPTTVSFENTDDAPYLEYSLYLNEDGDYTLTVYTAPSNNLFHNSRLRYAVSFDKEPSTIVDSLPADFIAGDYNNDPWCKGVLENIRISTSTHRLNRGLHRLRFYGLDAGLVLQKLVLHKEPLPDSYLGPMESWYKKK